MRKQRKGEREKIRMREGDKEKKEERGEKGAEGNIKKEWKDANKKTKKPA